MSTDDKSDPGTQQVGPTSGDAVMGTAGCTESAGDVGGAGGAGSSWGAVSGVGGTATTLRNPTTSLAAATCCTIATNTTSSHNPRSVTAGSGRPGCWPGLSPSQAGDLLCQTQQVVDTPVRLDEYCAIHHPLVQVAEQLGDKATVYALLARALPALLAKHA